MTKEEKTVLHDLIFDELEGYIVPASIREVVSAKILKSILAKLGVE